MSSTLIFFERSAQMWYVTLHRKPDGSVSEHAITHPVKHESATPVYVLKREAKDDAAKSTLASLLRNSTDFGLSSTLAQWKA